MGGALRPCDDPPNTLRGHCGWGCEARKSDFMRGSRGWGGVFFVWTEFGWLLLVWPRRLLSSLLCWRDYCRYCCRPCCVVISTAIAVVLGVGSVVRMVVVAKGVGVGVLVFIAVVDGVVEVLCGCWFFFLFCGCCRRRYHSCCCGCVGLVLLLVAAAAAASAVAAVVVVVVAIVVVVRPNLALRSDPLSSTLDCHPVMGFLFRKKCNRLGRIFLENILLKGLSSCKK